MKIIISIDCVIGTNTTETEIYIRYVPSRGIFTASFVKRLRFEFLIKAN